MPRGVSSIKQDGKQFVVTADGKHVSARAVIITGGKVRRKLGIKNEDMYLNRGLTYCAWCDGPIFAGKEVAIIGGGNAALDAALNISKLVKHLYVINITPELTADPVMIDKVHELHNARVLNSTEVVALQGEKYLTGLDIHDKEKGTHKVLPVAGVFVEVGSVPATDYLKDFVSLNHGGEIVVDKYNMTSVDGVFAAGDITDVIEKQVIVAAGEGAKAAIQASQYLSRKGD